MSHNTPTDTAQTDHPISTAIGHWFDQHKRDLPWRHTRDPYLIWLSEIILQQTRVVQGLDYYRRFVSAYPTVADLAEDSEDAVLKLWQGLGYYSRARNLHAAARQAMVWEGRKADDRGWFPSRYTDLIQLKGVGPYTAAAIASFSSDEAVAVVDGNVYRVLARIFDLDTPIDTTRGGKEFQSLADSLLPSAGCGHHNQAMMELGALTCTPISPDCPNCPVASYCLAKEHGTIQIRPIKQGRVKVKERHFAYYIFKYENTLYVHQRQAGDIWQGLWEFYLTEGDSLTPPASMQDPAVASITPVLSRKHQLTHQTLYAEFLLVELYSPIELGPGYRRISWDEWQNMAVPKLISDANKAISFRF